MNHRPILAWISTFALLALPQWNTPVVGRSSAASIPSGVNGQSVTNNGSGATSYSAQSPSTPPGNGGSPVSLASSNYTIACDSATVATGIQDRARWIYVGTAGANSVILPDLAGTGCTAMFGGIENATSSTITVARQTSDTFTIFGPGQQPPLSGQTSFSLLPGQWAGFSNDPTSTVYDIRLLGSGTIAAGTAALGTGAISSGTCATAVTASATGVATTDTVQYTPNTDPTAVTGYAPSATGSLYIWAYPTSGNVNFKVCNNTSGSITPSALTLNWRVSR